MLFTSELLEDNQLPSLDQHWPEDAKYVSLWATRDVTRIQGIKIF